MKRLLSLILAGCAVVLAPSVTNAAVTTATVYGNNAGPVRMTADGDITCSPNTSRTVGSIQVTSATTGKKYRLIDSATSTTILFDYQCNSTGDTFNAHINDLYVPSGRGLEYDTDDTTTGTGHSITVYFVNK